MTVANRGRILRNTLAQVIGRNAIAVGRLGIAALIVRLAGRETFAEYSLLFTILTVAEWLLDFGITEIFVRDICRDPQSEPHLLRVLTAAKAAQLPLAMVGACAILFVLHYPWGIVRAGLVGTLSLVFFAGLMIFRVVFKAHLMLDREVAAEAVSVFSMIPMVWWVTRTGGGLLELMLCHVVSRGMFLAVAWLLVRRMVSPSVAGTSRPEVWAQLRTASAIGLSGLMVVAYESLDILVLSKLTSLNGLAYYSASQRLVWPMLMALSAVGATLYPIVASAWPNERDRFEEACQRGVDSVLVMASLGIAAFLAGAEFFLGLLGREMTAGAPVLRIIALLCFVKAVTATVGPILYILNAQVQALRFITVAVLAKGAIIILLAPPYGYMGVAIGSIAVELIFAAIPSVILLQRLSQFRLRWYAPAKVVTLSLGVSYIVHSLLQQHPLAAAVAAPAALAPLVFLTGIVQVSDLQLLLRRRSA